MDLPTLRQFVHLSKSLHFSKTAEAMHISPSTLSRRITKLEAEIGVILFERDNRTVLLTQAGQKFCDFAASTLVNWQHLQSQLQDTPFKLKGQIRLYCSVTASYTFMLDLLTELRNRHPHIEVILETGDHALAIEKVTHNETDIAISPRPEQLANNLRFHSIASTPLEFIAPTVDCPIQTQLATSPIDWSRIPFVVPEHGLARRRLDHWFHRQSITPTIYAQVAGHEAIVSMVGLGLGIGVVPGLVIENSPLKNKIGRLDVTPVLAPFDVGICVLKRRLQDPLVQAFWSTAESLRSL